MVLAGFGRVLSVDDITGGTSFCPSAEIEAFSHGRQQFMISNCMVQYRSQSHFTDFRFFDVGFGGRFGGGSPHESIGKFIFMNGNFWLQKPMADTGNKHIASKMQLKYGFSLCDMNAAGPFDADADVFSIHADICYNPNSALDHLNKSSVFAGNGMIFKISPHIGYSCLSLDSSALAGGGLPVADTLKGFDVRMGLFAAYIPGNNYMISSSASFRNVSGRRILNENKYSLRLSKEFFFQYEGDKKWKEPPYLKTLELYCALNYYDAGINARHVRYSSVNIGISFYKYKEYINVYEDIRHMN